MRVFDIGGFDYKVIGIEIIWNRNIVADIYRMAGTTCPTLVNNQYNWCVSTTTTKADPFSNNSIPSNQIWQQDGFLNFLPAPSLSPTKIL